MALASFGLIVSALYAALMTLGALQSAVYAANGRAWEIGAWTAATLTALAAAAWCAVRTLTGEGLEPPMTLALALAPLPVTLALIARSWASGLTRARDGED